MKILGFIAMLGGVWWAYLWRHDPVQGPLFTPLGCLAVAAGFFMFFEGMKREIIEAVRNNDKNDTPPQLDKRE